MYSTDKNTIRLALLDLYNGVDNMGKRNIHDIVKEWGINNGHKISVTEFNVRQKNEVPDVKDFDVFISSGGPGSPLDTEGSEWEQQYFKWLGELEEWNNGFDNYPKKHCFFICHSFQLICRHYKLGTVNKRKSTSFGIFPVSILPGEEYEPVFDGLKNPFYVVDNRDYQLIHPDRDKIKAMGGRPLALEKHRPHVVLERAIMAIRFNDYFIGTQFHPEADPEGMKVYLHREDKKQSLIENHSQEKWESMLEHLNDPDKIINTHSRVIPNFLRIATEDFVEA